MTIETKLQSAYARLDAAIKAYNPIAVFGLFSGGHDSFSSTYVASQHPSFTAAVHVNTGIGIEATRDYVRETCADRGFDLLEYKAEENTAPDGTPDPQIYDEFVREFGFPGPAGHGMMYYRLKERQLLRLERDFKATSGRPEYTYRTGKRKGQTRPAAEPRRVMYVSGCRSQESQRRMANTDEVQVDGRRIWVAPIHDFSKLDTREALDYAQQKPSEVVQLIHKSGECLCGAFAKPEELKELACWKITKPAYDRIVKLEAQVVPKFGRGWGERPIEDNQTIVHPGMLCWGCHHSGLAVA